MSMAESSGKQITLTIDNKQITVSDGATVLQACEKAGSPIPFYCYHPGFSIAGNCRICLVEIQGSPKLQIGCHTRVAEGMSVLTMSDKVLKARQDVLEFLLINHPLDCPVCDQAGECWLQDYYMHHGLYDQRFNETKVKKTKATPAGPTVMLDAERCILCSRCVRFTDEITKTGEFGIFNRGDHSEIGLQANFQLTNKYSGNVVDICPVGALTDRDFRFKCRVWYLASTDSIWPGCSRGCNIQIHTNRELAYRPHIANGKRVMRLKPRYNPNVNQWWMCDDGRYGYKVVDEGRIDAVQVRENGALRNGTWEEAFGILVQTLKRLGDTNSCGKIGVILSSSLTNEDLYVAKRVFAKLGVSQLVFQRPPSGESDAFLIQADKSPNSRGAKALGFREGAEELLKQASKSELQVLFVFTQDLVPLYGESCVRKAAERLEQFVFIGTNANATSQMAHLVFPSAAYAEKDGTFTNCDGRVQQIHSSFAPLDNARPEWHVLSELASKVGLAISFKDPQSIFTELAQQEALFRGLTYATIGEHGILVAS